MSTLNYSYDARDRLLSAGATSYSYDQNGNVLSAGSRTFAYDLANRLKQTTQASTTTTYLYDGDGVRLQASTGAQANKKTNFLWDVSFALPQIALERDGNSNPIRRYTYGVRRISQTAGTTTSYFLYDGLGSTVNLTSSAGATQWTWSYEPFGGIRTETKASGNQPENRMRFTGEYQEPTGLYHLRARQYDPQVGRFLTRDPAEQTVNEGVISAYSYVANSPTVFVDPSGEVFVPSNRAEVSARVASGLTSGVSTSPSGNAYPRADGCVRRVSGSSGYKRYSVLYPAARLLPFPFHAALSIDAFPVTCRGSRWTVHWWARVDTSALTGPFGEFWRSTTAAIGGEVGGWRVLGTLWWKGGLNPARDYWGTHEERYAFISVNPPRQFERGRLVLAVFLDQELGIFPGLPPALLKRAEFLLGRQ